MGNLNPFKRKKEEEFYDPSIPPLYDPFAPPPYPYGGYGPMATGVGYPPPPMGYGGGLESYDPYGPYGYDPTISFGSSYPGPRRPPPPFGGSFGQGPWNYGNYYLGNTTMQLMPFMMRKVGKYNQRMGMGGGMPMMPMMPMVPCLPAAPMLAAASPLPAVYNPLIQNLYSTPMLSGASWMSPASFMSNLSAGPLMFRPPASFEFPSGVGAVMNLPFGWNSFFPTPTFGGFSPQWSFGSGWSCCCTFCCPPPITFCPRPVSVPQPVPVPYPAPVPIPNIQQVPIPRPVQVINPPIIAGAGQPLPLSAPGAPLMPSQGGFTQAVLGPTTVMASKRLLSTTDTLPDERKTSNRRSTTDSARRLKAERLAASLSKLGVENQWPEKHSRKKRTHHSHKHRKKH